MKCLNQTTQQIANKIDSQKFLPKKYVTFIENFFEPILQAFNES